MKVIVLRKVVAYLENLIQVLYDEEYFSYKEVSRNYVKELYAEIEKQLPTKLHKPAPEYFEKYGKGMYYAVFKKSKRTSWYVFFRMYRKGNEIIYQIRYIANNHIVAQHFLP